MTKEEFFESNIVPCLDDVISWRLTVCLTEEAINSLLEMGLIKDQWPTINIESGDYLIELRKPINQIIQIKKGSEILYKYDDRIAFEERPRFEFLDIY